MGREKMEIGKEGGEKKNEWGNLVFILPNPHGENRSFLMIFPPQEARCEVIDKYGKGNVYPCTLTKEGDWIDTEKTASMHSLNEENLIKYFFSCHERKRCS